MKAGFEKPAFFVSKAVQMAVGPDKKPV